MILISCTWLGRVTEIADRSAPRLLLALGDLLGSFPLFKSFTNLGLDTLTVGVSRVPNTMGDTGLTHGTGGGRLSRLHTCCGGGIAPGKKTKAVLGRISHSDQA